MTDQPVVTCERVHTVCVPEKHVVVVESNKPADHAHSSGNVLHQPAQSRPQTVLVERHHARVVALGPTLLSIGSGVVGAVFIQDVVAVGGVAGLKNYSDSGAKLDSCTVDVDTVRVFVGASGGKNYAPVVKINDIPATLIESATKRWFTGFADLILSDGDNEIIAKSDEGASDKATITLAGPGPDVLSVTFGAYPNGQTELKNNDVIEITVVTEADAVSATLLVGGANAVELAHAVAGGVTTFPVIVSDLSGAQSVHVKARNALGTYGTTHISSETVMLNQTYPTIGAVTVIYPSGKQAFGAGDSGSFAATVSNFDTVSYTSPDFTIDSPEAYAASKAITNTRSGYVGSGTNLFITASRAANGASASRSALVKVATVSPTAAISIAGNPARLVSTQAGADYEIRITQSQTLAAAPSLAASSGTWQGGWIDAGGYWKRSLRIADADAKGTQTFSGLSLTGLSNLTGSEITGGAIYSVGGFSLRTVTFPAFSRVAPLGCAVVDASKLSAAIVGGAPLTRYTDNGVRPDGFYPANADGGYNANGAYLGLSDSAFAGSNTTGTLQATVQEAA